MGKPEKFVVRVEETRSPDRVRRVMRITGHDDIWFEVLGPVLPPPLEVWDFAAIAMIFIAMRKGADVHIDGPVTAQCLRNLGEFQDLWLNWVPKGYSRVDFTAARIVEEPVLLSRDGMFAYSGGVDGTCTLLRHLDGSLGVRRIKPKGVTLIHGFDIPIEDEKWFAKAEEDARAALKDFDIPFFIVRTNWRIYHFPRWALEHGAGLFAALHQFTGVADWGVIGANEDYKNLVIPWGTSPLFNHFFSGARFAIHTECAGMTRCERVEKICEYPEVAKHVRVCWENTEGGMNCGQCEKCIRTKLNFIAVGHDPVCFDRPPTFLEIIRVKTRERMKISYIREILAEANARGVSLKWRLPVFLLVVKAEVFYVLRQMKKALKARLLKSA
ncbi:MAG: hypothetical protein R3C58_08680 [Parvularculaceae bacterium]